MTINPQTRGNYFQAHGKAFINTWLRITDLRHVDKLQRSARWTARWHYQFSFVDAAPRWQRRPQWLICQRSSFVSSPSCELQRIGLSLPLVSWHHWYDDYAVTLHSAMGTHWVTLRFVGWVWYMLLQHTWALKEMSARLYSRWWQTLRWIPTHQLGEINEFLEETFSLLGFLLLPSMSSKLSGPVLIFSHILILALALWLYCSSLPLIAIHSSISFCPCASSCINSSLPYGL